MPSCFEAPSDCRVSGAEGAVGREEYESAALAGAAEVDDGGFELLLVGEACWLRHVVGDEQEGRALVVERGAEHQLSRLIEADGARDVVEAASDAEGGAGEHRTVAVGEEARPQRIGNLKRRRAENDAGGRTAVGHPGDCLAVVAGKDGGDAFAQTACVLKDARDLGEELLRGSRAFTHRHAFAQSAPAGR